MMTFRPSISDGNFLIKSPCRLHSSTAAHPPLTTPHHILFAPQVPRLTLVDIVLVLLAVSVGGSPTCTMEPTELDG